MGLEIPQGACRNSCQASPADETPGRRGQPNKVPPGGPDRGKPSTLAFSEPPGPRLGLNEQHPLPRVGEDQIGQARITGERRESG